MWASNKQLDVAPATENVLSSMHIEWLEQSWLYQWCSQGSDNQDQDNRLLIHSFLGFYEMSLIATNNRTNTVVPLVYPKVP